jgi:4-amino-4-deoxy-L-arabinose transferase-like glycosyltransferase
MALTSPFTLAAALRDALTGPARRGRTLALTLAGFAALWTLYGVLAKASQGVHFDMAELSELARHPAFGDAKSPPFAIWTAAVWFAVFPRADWSFYLLAMTSIVLALVVAWRLYGRLLDPDKQLLALVLLSLIPLLTFHALKFNNNALMIPLWAAAIYFFVRSYDRRGVADAALAGLFAAAAMLDKYWSIFLIVGLAAAALSDRRRAEYFRSPAPWITAATGALALAPHLLWLAGNRFQPFGYALAVHGGRGLADSIASIGGYLGGAAAYAAIPVAIAFAVTQPSRAALADLLWPPDGPRRFIAVAFWVMLLSPALVALASGTEIVSLWTMPVWVLLPLVLLSPPTLAVRRNALTGALVAAVAVPVIAVLAAPVTAIMINRAGSAGPGAYYKPLAAAVERAWRAASSQPLGFIAGDGDYSYGAAFYLPWQAAVFPEFSRELAPWIDPSAMARGGVALVCAAENAACVARIKVYAANAEKFQIDEPTLAMRFLGSESPPKKFVIIVVPPMNALAAK